MRLAAGARLGAFTIVGPLGAGGMGEVYLARDSRLERDVALKVLPSRLTNDAETRARFRQEALTLASLNHPNLATVHGFEEDDEGSLVLVLERVEGESLARRLEAGVLGLDQALRVGLQVAQALEAAHERGIVHRDVKPGNIMIGPRGLVKVLDFGLARRVGAPAEPGAAAGHAAPSLEALAAAEEGETVVIGAPREAASGPTTSGVLAGTPGYMSPEQATAAPVDARTDVFALGCVLYEALSGRRAFPGATPEIAIRAVLESKPDLGALPAEVPTRVRKLIARCLAHAADARPDSAGVVRRELEAVLGLARAAERAATTAVRHNLPAPATSFVGREAVLEACGRALGGTRLLTLTGIGGSGKTRLALELAAARTQAFPGGVWFVDVAPLAGPERLVEVLAAAVGAKEEPGVTLGQAVARALEQAPALVLLDNAETHRDASSALAASLLGACRELRVLVTSREPLEVAGETVYAVPELAVPGGRIAKAAEASRFESVLLFAERARAAAPAFELTDENAAAVAEICRRLDGIPLAIELAAARVRLLGVEQVRARLGDRFKLLTRSGSGPGRQQTVLAVIEWSWDHLLPPEQRLMTHLAAFAGGWTLEQAAAVHDPGTDEFEVLDLLTRLVERSLVVADHGPTGDVRYRFLESVWRFAQDRLEAAPDGARARDRHLELFMAIAARGEQDMTGPKVGAALATLTIEEENLLAALDWSGRTEDGALKGLALVASCHRMWNLLGRYDTGRRAVARALAADKAASPSPERAKLLVRASGFELTIGELDSARRYLEESLAICRSLGDQRGIARSISGLGVLAMWQERFDETITLSSEGLAIYESLDMPRGVAMLLHNIASAELALGRFEPARPHFERALELFRAVGDLATEALCLSSLASALLRLGDVPGATERLRECLRLLAPLEVPRESVIALEALADLFGATGRPREGARMVGAAERSREELGMPLMPSERMDFDRARADLESALGATEYGEARLAGRELGLQGALAEARALLGES